MTATFIPLPLTPTMLKLVEALAWLDHHVDHNGLWLK